MVTTSLWEKMDIPRPLATGFWRFLSVTMKLAYCYVFQQISKWLILVDNISSLINQVVNLIIITKTLSNWDLDTVHCKVVKRV